ncbi:MAG: SurA N-terminal domain-containing protein [Buchnera aphidicola (Nurudea yanoniella)]
MIKKKIKKILSKLIILILLIIIIFSLVFMKFNYYSIKDKKNYIIKINNDEIHLEEFQKKYIFLLSKYKYNSNNFHNTNYIKKIYKEAILDIIYKTLLKQYVKKLHISLNDSEIKNYIHNNSDFQEKNIFKIEKYYYFLNKENISSNEYIDKIKTYLKIKKFISFISNLIFISKHEKNNLIQSLSQIRIIKIASVPLTKFFKNTIINNKNIINYLKKNNSNLFSIKKYKNNTFLILKKTTYEFNNKPVKLLKTIKLKFQKSLFFSRFDKNKFKKFIFNLPNLKKNKNIYFSIIKNSGDLLLIKFYKTMHIDFSNKQKNVIISQLKKYNLGTILNSILDDLYLKAHISYGNLIDFNNKL